MQGVKDTAANIAASAVSGMEKTKATVQEKVERMTTHDPEQKEMATEKKQERITQAELDKQEAKQYRAAVSKYGASATGGQDYYSSETTGGRMTSGHDTHTHSATEDTGYPMGAHRTSAMSGRGSGQQYGGQEEEGVVSSYPGGLQGDSTTGHNTRAGGTAFRTGSDGTGQSYGTDGTGYKTRTDGTRYGTRQPYGGQEEEGVENIYPDGLQSDSITDHNTRAGDNAFRTGTDGTGHGTRQPYGRQVEEGVENIYPDGFQGDSITDHNTRAGDNASGTRTDGTGYTTGTDGTGYVTRQPYGRQVEEGVENIYPDGLQSDSITDHNTRAGDNAFRTGTDGTGHGTRQPYGRQVEEGVENIYPDGFQGDSIIDHNTRAGGNASRTRTDGTGYTTGTDGTGYGTRQPYGRQVEEGVENIYPDGLPGDSTTDHNTRAGGNAFRTGTDGTEYTTGTGTGSNAPDWRL